MEREKKKKKKKYRHNKEIKSSRINNMKQKGQMSTNKGSQNHIGKKKIMLTKHDTFHKESMLCKYLVPQACRKSYCIRRSIVLIESAMLILILLIFATFALLHFEAEVEITNNEEYIKFIQKIKTTTNITANDFDKLIDYIGVDPVTGTENFVGYDVKAGTWVAGRKESFVKVMFFAFTLISTIGYGDFSVSTIGGKWISLVVMLVGVPLTVVTYSTFTRRIFEVIMHTVLRNSGEVKAAFDKFDVDNTGELDAEELQHAFAELNLILSLEEVEAFIDERDDDFSGTLTSMLRKHVHRYVKCISLQIVLRQLQSKLKHHMQNLDKKKKNSQRLIATPNHMDSFLYLTDKQVDDSNEVDEYIEDLNFNKDFGVKHNDEKNEYHFMYESSDSDVDNLDELQKYALSSKEVELVINS